MVLPFLSKTYIFLHAIDIRILKEPSQDILDDYPIKGVFQRPWTP